MARRERFGEGVVILHHDPAPLPFNAEPPCSKMPLNREADGGGEEIMSFVDDAERHSFRENVARIRITFL